MRPLSGVLGEAWELYRRHAAHFLVISFVVYVTIAVITALLYTFGGFLGSLLAEVVSGTLVAPFIACVVTLVYYRAASPPSRPRPRRPGTRFSMPA